MSDPAGADARARPRRAGAAGQTVAAYDRDAAAYVAHGPALPDAVRVRIEELAQRLGAGARVLEVGSGGGRDALLMEHLGLRVRRTDVTAAFVTLLREQGHEADVLDPLDDEWWTHGAISRPRHFTYWRAPALAEVVAASGWVDVVVRAGVAGSRGESWLEVSAVRDEVSP